jgi:hypothetical protein
MRQTNVRFGAVGMRYSAGEPRARAVLTGDRSSMIRDAGVELGAGGAPP